MAVDHRWSGRFKEDDDLVDRILSQNTRDVVPTVPLTASVQDAGVTDQSSIERAANIPQAPVQPATIVSPPVSILALAERLIEEKAKLNEWRPKT